MKALNNISRSAACYRANRMVTTPYGGRGCNWRVNAPNSSNVAGPHYEIQFATYRAAVTYRKELVAQLALEIMGVDRQLAEEELLTGTNLSASVLIKEFLDRYHQMFT